MKKVADLNFKSLEDKLKKIYNQRTTLFVGWDNPEMAKIAGIQEYGATITVTDKMRKFLAWKYEIYLKKTTTHIIIPPRAHRYQVVQENKDKWSKQLATLLEKNNYNLVKSLGALGVEMRKDYIGTLKQGKFQELSAATMLIREKKNIAGSQPLYATRGLALNLTFEVYNG
jgi:hypothetical protein